ncbi:hypothetical protein EV207_1654 [Scopulibacillus darangshiensis]|uniref:Uncharacterized protein n=1 Tax=Scopulibacillus darangshiensis TaxID=442528 RepID=A0A4R2NDW5_9BACL|nr:hypothetical protein EV207_1654 [Scopulibacillus darangshiensis]
MRRTGRASTGVVTGCYVFSQCTYVRQKGYCLLHFFAALRQNEVEEHLYFLINRKKVIPQSAFRFGNNPLKSFFYFLYPNLADILLPLSMIFCFKQAMRSSLIRMLGPETLMAAITLPR